MKKILRIVTALILVSGISLTIGNGFTYTKAQLSGGGATLMNVNTSTTGLHASAPIESIVPAYEQANAGLQMVIGILLILLGFFLHAFLMSQDKRAVHITVKPRTKRKAHGTRWYWMEMRV